MSEVFEIYGDEFVSQCRDRGYQPIISDKTIKKYYFKSQPISDSVDEFMDSIV